MDKAGCEVRIGTSGWYYDHWLRRFYPEDLPKADWLGYYARTFDTVEINNTFYHLPKEQTLEKWHNQAPRGFIYTVKANRYITHIKKLKNVKEEVGRFFDAVEILAEHLGPILYQLPPSMHKDLKLLGSFMELLPSNRLAVFEFRHTSWYADDVYGLLDKHAAAFCVHDLGELAAPRIITGKTIYLRFHGTSGRYAGNYTKSMLSRWAKWIEENRKNVSAVYAYFNNDVEGHAVENTKTLKSLLCQRSRVS